MQIREMFWRNCVASYLGAPLFSRQHEFEFIFNFIVSITIYHTSDQGNTEAFVAIQQFFLIKA